MGGVEERGSSVPTIRVDSFLCRKGNNSIMSGNASQNNERTWEDLQKF